MYNNNNNNKQNSSALNVFGEKSKDADDLLEQFIKMMTITSGMRQMEAGGGNTQNQVNWLMNQILGGEGPSPYGESLWQGVGKPRQSFKQDPTLNDITDIVNLVSKKNSGY
jgi:hypothetical protein